MLFVHHGAKVLELDLYQKKSPSVVAKLGGKTIWKHFPPSWGAWKIAVADVDGDHNEEFIVGLYRVSRHSPHPIHTLYVYGFDGASIYPRWRGSRMARDFVDFDVAKAKNGDKILTLDRLLDGRFTLSCYAWNGFGFRKEWEHGAWKKARLQEGKPGTITVVTEGGAVTFSTEGKQ
ncbi:MAG TPA: hypothetical protein VHE55_02425 [Fimbriimonadaceae bacterium]|nr:hypothetical protein [Fimbriimonadaceae bacterium]